jgi:hypothetical protein
VKADDVEPPLELLVDPELPFELDEEPEPPPDDAVQFAVQVVFALASVKFADPACAAV